MFTIDVCSQATPDGKRHFEKQLRVLRGQDPLQINGVSVFLDKPALEVSITATEKPVMLKCAAEGGTLQNEDIIRLSTDKNHVGMSM